MRPTDVLAHRRLVNDWAREMLRDADAVTRRAADNGEALSEVTEMSEQVAWITGQGDAYYVTADMSAVAMAAARMMPDQDLHIDDVPSSEGFLLYDRPVGEWNVEGRGYESEATPVEGFMWSLGSVGSEGESDAPPTGCTRKVDVYPVGRFQMFPYVIPLMAFGALMSWEIGGEPANDSGNLGPVLRATWTIMQQSLSVQQRTGVERAERRRSLRSGLASDVVVVRLRRKSLDEPRDDHAEGVDVAWSHQWLVSGHWRNQWLPSRSSHRLQWINGYVKGPSDKPLVVKDRVTAWVR